MKLFETMLDGLPLFHSLLSELDRPAAKCSLFGLSPIHRGLLIANLVGKIKDRPLLLVTESESEGRRCVEDINSFLGKELAGFFPARDWILTDLQGASREFETQRLEVLGKLAKGSLRVVVCCADGLMQYTIPKEALASHTKELSLSQSLSQTDLLAALEKGGYERRDQVEGRSQYALRGGILDFFPPQEDAPIRLEFWGDEIDSISTFSLETQRRTANLSAATLPPARELIVSKDRLCQILSDLLGKQKKKEALIATLEKELDILNSGLPLACQDKYYHEIYQTPATLLSHLERPIVIIGDINGLKERATHTLWQHAEEVKSLLEQGSLAPVKEGFFQPLEVLWEQLDKTGYLLTDTFARGSTILPVNESFQLPAFSANPWGGLLSAILEDIRFELARGYCVIVSVKTQRGGKSLVSDLQKEGIDASFSSNPSSLLLGKVIVTEGNFSAGFTLPDLRVTLITQGQSAKGGLTLSSHKKKTKKSQQFHSLEDLVVGDYLVHVTHGIGIFQGIVPMEVGGLTKDYIKIQYADSGVLYLPVNQLDMVSRYLGGKDDKTVKLNRLGSADWEKTKTRVKKAVKEMARELIDLYAKRLHTKGYAFAPDDSFCQEFDARFEYEETEDQLLSVDQIKKDMEKEAPMDRLLCGDVGFGKTEVALRAAFKCMYEGKQCAILVPTTILAWQHYQTALKRFEGYPFRVELLSRFRKPKGQKKTLEALAEGKVDLVIGTHRLIQKDVKFADLGLAIIDEEQRFGVAHKERFKEEFAGVDVLTLSATPIPRTLNMAMSGIRDMSVIEQPPVDRQPVQTFVLEHQESLIIEAIQKELRRGGQVFYLHNHVETILETAAHLSALLPQARIDVGHGKMGEEELSKVWERMLSGETDVLVCTTIIETGVDLPNCNTLIVENADRLGLSQLYQLRGRVGRSARRAFAYFTFPPYKVLNEISAKRLEAIREFTNFGSGFKIAMRDLQIRGAGSVLGASQHGHMEQVGYDMYLRLLEQAVKEEKGEAPPQKQEANCLVDLKLNAHIPDQYIKNYGQRIEIYQKIASLTKQEELVDLTDELIDRFGTPPDGVLGLMEIALLRNRAIRLQILEIRQTDTSLLFYLGRVDREELAALVKEMPGRILINSSSKPYLSVRLQKGESPIRLMDTLLSNLEKIQKNHVQPEESVI